MLLYQELDKLADMQQLYNAATTVQKQQLITLGFDSKLYYKEQLYRTPFIMPIFSHNTMILKEKQLLVLDEKRGLSVKVPHVELQGFEPWSKHTRRKPSTCLFLHYLSGKAGAKQTNLFLSCIVLSDPHSLGSQQPVLLLSRRKSVATGKPTQRP